MSWTSPRRDVTWRGLGGGRRCTEKKHGVGRCTQLYDGSGGVAAHVHGRPCVPRRGSRMREARVDEGTATWLLSGPGGARPRVCCFLLYEMIRPARRDGPRRSRLECACAPALLQPCVLLILRKQPWPLRVPPWAQQVQVSAVQPTSRCQHAVPVHVQTNTYTAPPAMARQRVIENDATKIGTNASVRKTP